MVYEICKACGRFFEKNGNKYCDKCFAKEEKMYQQVKDLVAAHQGITVIQVIKETGVSIKTLRRHMQEGDLEAVNRGNNCSLDNAILRIKQK